MRSYQSGCCFCNDLPPAGRTERSPLSTVRIDHYNCYDGLVDSFDHMDDDIPYDKNMVDTYMFPN